MKIKISWPVGIVVAIVAFMVFILSFVYKATFVSEYDHHLVSEEYYKDELHYQEEIDKLNKGVALKQNVAIEKTAEGLVINFPTEFKPEAITGTVFFKRLSNEKIDFNFPIELKTHQLFIKDEKLVDGRWDVKIEWFINNDEYLFKEKLMY